MSTELTCVDLELTILGLCSLQERKGKKKPKQCLPHPPPESVDPCLSKIRKSYLQKEEPEEGEGVGKRRMRL